MSTPVVKWHNNTVSCDNLIVTNNSVFHLFGLGEAENKEVCCDEENDQSER